MIEANKFLKRKGIVNMMIPRGLVVEMLDAYGIKCTSETKAQSDKKELVLRLEIEKLTNDKRELKSRNRALKKSFEHKKMVLKNIMNIAKFEI